MHVKKICELCDKIIELDEAHKKRPYAYTGDFYDECENHAAKLARALKKYRSGINAIGDYVDLHWNRKNQNDVQYINAIEVKIDELEKEIEEIFK